MNSFRRGFTHVASLSPEHGQGSRFDSRACFRRPPKNNRWGCFDHCLSSASLLDSYRVPLPCPRTRLRQPECRSSGANSLTPLTPDYGTAPASPPAPLAPSTAERICARVSSAGRGAVSSGRSAPNSPTPLMIPRRASCRST